MTVGVDSYVTLQEAKDFLAARGVVLADAEIEVLSVQATDYIDSYKFYGNPTGANLEFPRVVIRNAACDERKVKYNDGTEVPADVKKATLLAMQLLKTDSTQSANGNIKRERLGSAVEVEYFANGYNETQVAIVKKIYSLLYPYTVQSGTLRTKRV